MGNILDKKDRSMKGGPIAPHLLKSDVFSWYTGSPEGRFTMLNKNVLNIEGEYQRTATSQKKISTISRNWDWALFGTLDVSIREDGTYWVYDGGHRLRASFHRADVIMLPCMVHIFSTLSDEAKAFVSRNTMVSNVNAIARFNASVVAGEPLSIEAKSLLNKMGLSVTDSPNSKKGISCIGKVLQIMRDNRMIAARCIELCDRLSQDSNINSNVLGGIFALQMHFLPERDIMNDFSGRFEITSQVEIAIEIRKFRAETGKGGDVISAKGVMLFLNKGLRTRKLIW